MCKFVQTLESRTLLSASVTSTTLIADAQQLSVNAGNTRADLKSAGANIAADNKTLTADLKTLANATNRKTNAGLLAKLKSDEGKALAKLRADSNVLLGKSTAIANRSIADAKGLLLHPTNAKLGAKVAADVQALNTVSASPLATLQADIQNVSLGVDLTNIAAANPSSTTLANDVQRAQSDGSSSIGNVGTAASNYNSQLASLASDAGSAPTTATPANLVGSYTGSYVATAGNHVGQARSLTMQITNEGTDGSFTGTAVTTDGSGGTIALDVTGSVTSAGAFTASLTDPIGGQNGASLTGTVHGKAIDGTYTSNGDSGTFTLKA
ncbi:MAG TPA: hypothetical protein VFC78_12690 [Tepidisphaeraceae bacterium]|nr:hypothetical protein [Tepidisphaeraceae bacterium]